MYSNLKELQQKTALLSQELQKIANDLEQEIEELAPHGDLPTESEAWFKIIVVKLRNLNKDLLS